jgi:hypothetical protein
MKTTLSFGGAAWARQGANRRTIHAKCMGRHITSVLGSEVWTVLFRCGRVGIINGFVSYL